MKVTLRMTFLSRQSYVGDKERAFTTQGFLNTRFNNRELHTQHIFLTTQQDRNWSLIFG